MNHQGSRKFSVIKNGEKQCTECMEWKELKNFRIRKDTKIGYNSRCRDCVNKKQREYRSSEKGKNSNKKYCISEKGKENYKKYRTSEKGKIVHKRYRSSEKGKIVQERWLKTEGGKKRKICNRICNGVRYSLNSNKNGKHWEDLVGWKFENFKEHFEPLFQQGMNWNNHGEWHIDHIKPIASFNITDYNCSDFKECWSLNNLQPLWAIENISKGDKWNEHN